MKKITKKEKENNVLKNGFTSLVNDLSYNSNVQLSDLATLSKNNRTNFLTNEWTTLTYAYITHGIIKAFIDQPVEDALRGGIDILSEQASQAEIKEVQDWMIKRDFLKTIKSLMKWAALYGGGGLVINTLGKSDKPLNVSSLQAGSPLEFYASDPWELNKSTSSAYGEVKPYVKSSANSNQFWFYGNKIDKSRVLIMLGDEAPSLARPQIRYWGLSKLEMAVRSLNSYFKNQNMVFELIDESKIDIYKFDGLIDRLKQEGGEEIVKKQVKLTNSLKNYLEAVVMDKQDDYEQKQINFSGLAEIANQNKFNIAADLHQPMTKIFGMSAAGFNAGEDDIENYNSGLESERNKADNIIIKALEVVFQVLFGKYPTDLSIKYKPLKTLSAEQEQLVHTSKISNLTALYDRGLITSEDVIKEINNQKIFNSSLDEIKDDFPLPPPSKPKLDLDSTNNNLNKEPK